MNGRFTATQVPADHQSNPDRSVGLAVLQPLEEQRHEQQRGVELRGRAEAEQHAGPPSRRRDHATIAPVAAATATRSQFMWP